MIAKTLDFVKGHPVLLDLARRCKRIVVPGRDEVGTFLDRFSTDRPDGVRFIQIGANDGLRNDPIREFVVRDHWQGIFVEPLPSVFPILQRNYSYVKNPHLQFFNCAIGTDDSTSLVFWSFLESFLDGRTTSERMSFLRKASFDREFVIQNLPAGCDPDIALRKIEVPVRNLNALIREEWRHERLDLLVIDAEGFDAKIIRSIDFDFIKPAAIFFEAKNLPEGKESLFSFLVSQGYEIQEFGRDACAIRQS